MIYIKNNDRIQLSELDLPSKMAGEFSQQTLKMVNTYTTAVNVLIKAVKSEVNQQGTAAATYNAVMFSTNGTDFTDSSITVTVAASSSTTFYMRYAPASTTIPGEKEFALKYYEVN